MSLKRRALKGSLLLALGQGVIYGCSFLRNMILARMLTKADFGIAATFSLIITLLEFSAKLGTSQFVIRDKEGDNPEFISSVHLVQFAVGMLSSVAIAAFASPLSVLFGIPNQRWAILLLALEPLFRGLEHLDVRRFERYLRYTPSLVVEALPQAVTTLATWPVAWWLGDYRAVLVLLLTKGLASCLGSHLFAEQPYRWRINRLHIAHMLQFGWPLFVNSFLLFGVLQGDQFLIATTYSMSELAPYAAAATLTVAPTVFFGRVFNSVMLPVLAGVQEDPAAFGRRYHQVLAAVTLFATVCGTGMILGGEALMRFVYGMKYSGAGILVGWLSASNAFRCLRVAPALAAIAKGDSKNQMISNSWRLLALVPALGLALAKQPLWSIACTGLLGEAAACFISFLLLKRRDDVSLSSGLISAGLILLAICFAGILVTLGFQQLPASLGLALAALASIIAAACVTPAFPELRSEVNKLYAQWRNA